MSNKVRNVIPPQLSHFTSGYAPKRNTLTSQRRHLQDVINSTIVNCEKLGGNVGLHQQGNGYLQAENKSWYLFIRELNELDSHNQHGEICYNIEKRKQVTNEYMHHDTVV